MSASLQKPLSVEWSQRQREEFYEDPKNILSQNVCSRFDPREVCINRRRYQQANHVYNIKVDSEVKPVTKQGSSGRCWLFAALNVIRLPFMKKYEIEEFEFSQAYLFFWDKIERSHYTLTNIVNTARRGEPLDGRLVSFMLDDPVPDGGQWDMLVNLINKYGLVPKLCFPESFSCTASLRMNRMLKTKIREFAKTLRGKVEANVSDEEIHKEIQCQMKVIYNIVSICLGTPSEKITFEFYKKNKEYVKFDTVTPLEFYQQYVKPVYDVNDKVCLVHDPRPHQQYGRLFTLEFLGNVVGGRPVGYNNQPIDVLLKAVKDSIEDNEAVWFGCEVSKMFDYKNGFEDLDALDYKTVFNTTIELGLNKPDRMLYRDSCMTHAMVFTAVSTDAEGKVTKLRVENSWGDDVFNKGYLLMTTEWFNEFVYEVVVDKKHVTKEILDVFLQKPVVLPIWDPMGTLALAN